jgi:hypothetical protein
MRKKRLPSATSSLTDSNPIASVNGYHPRENTDPLHDEDSPLFEFRHQSLIEESNEKLDEDLGESIEVKDMLYDPIDQDNTTNP